MDNTTAVYKEKPKSKVRGIKKPEKDLKGKTTKGKGKDVVLNYAKFEGQGLNYRCKLFGYVEVPGPRGDRTSVEAIHKLKQQAKQLKKGANEHKLKIIFNITLQGIRVINEKTQAVEHVHRIHKISFISHDPEDRHIFGYIFSPARTAEGRKYYLFAIKTEKSADAITSQLYELFQVVHKMQENRKVKSVDSNSQNQKPSDKASQPLEPLQDKMLLEMSSKLGGDQRHPTGEHLYEEPTSVQSSPPVSPKAHYAIPSGRPAYTSSNDEIKQNEGTGEKIDEVKSDPFSASGVKESIPNADKDAGPIGQSPLLQVPSDNIFPTSTSDHPGFEPGFDSAASPISTEPKVEDSNQFQAEFPPFDNGFESSKTEPRSANHPEEGDIFVANKHLSLSDQKKIATQTGANLDKSRDFRNSEEESDRINITGALPSTLSSTSNEIPKFEKSEGSEVNSASERNCSPDEVKHEAFTNIYSTVGGRSDIKGTRQTAEISQTITTDSLFGNNAKESDLPEIKTEKRSDGFGTNHFEVKFETEDEGSMAVQKRPTDVFSSFNNNSDVFPNEDPFSSHSTIHLDKSPFPEDDPFSPQGGTNKESASDPFAKNENISSSFDFGTEVRNKDEVFGESDNKEAVPSNQANYKTEETGENYNGDDDDDNDTFEAVFEAKMKIMDEEEINQQDKNKSVDDVMGIEENNLQVNKLANVGSDESETNAAPNSDALKDEVITENNTPKPSEEDSEEIKRTVTLDDEAGEQEGYNELNTLDLSTKDEYVTLNTTVPAATRPMSPSELSPPPLPPRPTLPDHIEPSNPPVIPKEPPALPPRPSSQSLNTETTIRKPPELPPRVDLEERDSKFDPLSDKINKSTLPDSAAHPLQSNFDFDNAKKNSDVTTKHQESKMAEFDVGDPFKDPFIGSDPFQTPIVGDPFASPSSFGQGHNDDSEGFDPFSGDDPFAPTTGFIAQPSFDSPNLSFQSQPSSDEPKDNQTNGKFADFSGFSTAFS